MDNQLYTALLNQASTVIKHHNEIAQISGERFNLFKIINLTTNEVRVHSALLAELLNPQGSHGQGATFLDLFMRLFEFPVLDLESCRVDVEKNIGQINEDGTRGGRIDIFISDKKGNCIAVENKIYAGDQDNQLIRYHNYCKEGNWKNSALLYLTLNGKEATKDSCGELKCNDDYLAISYQKDIIGWLEACRKECVLLPVLREGITHYINLIKLLTNQIGSQKMQDDILKLITSNPKYFEAADVLAKNIDSVKSSIQWNFWETLRKNLEEKLEEKGLSIIDDDKTASSTKTYKYHCEGRYNLHPGLWIKIFDKDGITIHWGAEIEWNFYTGFTIENRGEGGISDQKEYASYRNMVLEVNHGYLTDSKHWLGWKYSDPILNFRDFNTEQMYRLGDDDYLKKVVSDIADNAIQDINALKKKLPK
jgi:hypothetical protein